MQLLCTHKGTLFLPHVPCCVHVCLCASVYVLAHGYTFHLHTFLSAGTPHTCSCMCVSTCAYIPLHRSACSHVLTCPPVRVCVCLCMGPPAHGFTCVRVCTCVSGQPLAWQVVDVAAVHEEVPVLRVAQRGQVARERHAGAHVPPQGACPADTQTQTRTDTLRHAQRPGQPGGLADLARC